MTGAGPPGGRDTEGRLGGPETGRVIDRENGSADAGTPRCGPGSPQRGSEGEGTAASRPGRIPPSGRSGKRRFGAPRIDGIAVIRRCRRGGTGTPPPPMARTAAGKCAGDSFAACGTLPGQGTEFGSHGGTTPGFVQLHPADPGRPENPSLPSTAPAPRRILPSGGRRAHVRSQVHEHAANMTATDPMLEIGQDIPASSGATFPPCRKL